MPAPSIAALYDFETAYEQAAANWFINANTSWQILTPATLANSSANSEFLKTPRVTCMFSISGTGDQKAFQQSNEYYCERTGQLTIQAVVSRNNTQQSYSLIRGTARRMALEREQAFSNVQVPYYQTIDVTEVSSGQSSVEGNEEILTQIVFGVKFFIPPASFP